MGRSMSTGPGRPERIRWNACGERAGNLTGFEHRHGHLRDGGAAMAAMSTAWKSSLCSLFTGAWPVIAEDGNGIGCGRVQSGDHVGPRRAGRADADADVAGRRAGVSLRHVAGAFDVAGQDVA